MILTFVLLGVIFYTSLRQKSHIKIKAKCHKYLVKVSQMTRVPQVEYHCYTGHRAFYRRDYHRQVEMDSGGHASCAREMRHMRDEEMGQSLRRRKRDTSKMKVQETIQ